MRPALLALKAFRPKLKVCGDRVAGYKPIYSKRQAEEAKNRRWERDHVKLRIYHCDRCNFHHLTSQV